MKKRIVPTAWAVLDYGGNLQPWGCTCAVNGGVYRYPVFHSRNHARAFQRENPGSGKIIKVSISLDA